MTWTRWEKASHAHVAMVAGLAVATTMVLLAVAPHVAAEQPPAAGDQLAVYAGKIRPLLAERCFSCHGGLKQEAGLRLDAVALMLAGGDSGPAIVKGKPAISLLVERTKDHDPATRMPPEGEGVPLSTEHLAMLEAWIAAGCPAPTDEKPEADPRQHWAFQPRVRPEVPAVKDSAGVRNPIDAFLVAARE
jgi:hypothetical protein